MDTFVKLTKKKTFWSDINIMNAMVTCEKMVGKYSQSCFVFTYNT